MATMSAFLHDFGSRPKRTRKSHPKVKTGCLTCKIRRKKCDETRPSCKRCTSTGRKCDGYPILVSERIVPPTPPASTGTSPEAVQEADDGAVAIDLDIDTELLDRALTLPHKPGAFHFAATAESRCPEHGAITFLQLYYSLSIKHFSSQMEYSCFEFFCKKTGPEFSGYFDSSFWQGFLYKACYWHPTVLQAVVALGAAHRRFELGISPEAFQYCDFSMRSYTKAVQYLRRTLADNNPNAMQISMIVSMLFCAFETFQDNYENASQHMLCGLKILFDRKFRKIHSESRRRYVELDEKSLRKLFKKLEYQARQLFDGPANIDPAPSTGSSLPDLPNRFKNMNEARDTLFTHVRWIFDALSHSSGGPTGCLADQQEHIIRLLRWSSIYADYFKDSKGDTSLVAERATTLLRVYREATYLLLLLRPTDSGSVNSRLNPADVVARLEDPLVCNNFAHKSYTDRKEAMDAHFAKLLMLSDSLLDLQSEFAAERSSFSVDSGIVPPLYLAATRCRSTKVRHQATSILAMTPGREKIWEKLGSYAVAEKLSAMEEEVVLGCGALPTHLNPKWVDVTCFLEEKRILMRYCTIDPVDQGLIWTQEWIAF